MQIHSCFRKIFVFEEKSRPLGHGSFSPFKDIKIFVKQKPQKCSLDGKRALEKSKHFSKTNFYAPHTLVIIEIRFENHAVITHFHHFSLVWKERGGYYLILWRRLCNNSIYFNWKNILCSWFEFMVCETVAWYYWKLLFIKKNNFR